MQGEGVDEAGAVGVAFVSDQTVLPRRLSDLSIISCRTWLENSGCLLC